MGNLKSTLLGNSPPSPVDSVLTWRLASRLQPSDRAAFAVTSRLLASIVTESILRSYYVPIHSEDACGICVILSANVMSEHHVPTRSLSPVDIFAIIPLHQEPIFSGTHTRRGRPIWLLDPLDMVPLIFDISTRNAGSDGNVCLRPHLPRLRPFPHPPLSHLCRIQFYLPWLLPHGSWESLPFSPKTETPCTGGENFRRIAVMLMPG